MKNQTSVSNYQCLQIIFTLTSLITKTIVFSQICKLPYKASLPTKKINTKHTKLIHQLQEAKKGLQQIDNIVHVKMDIRKRLDVNVSTNFQKTDIKLTNKYIHKKT